MWPSSIGFVHNNYRVTMYLTLAVESATLFFFLDDHETSDLLKGPNMARGRVNSLFKNSIKTLEQEVSK